MKRLLLLAAALFLASCSDDDTATVYRELSADSLVANRVGYTEILDVSPHYDMGHIPGATNAGSVAGLDSIIPRLSESGSYVIYCHADAPSIAGAEALVDAGFENVYRLTGNYPAWDALAYVDIDADEVKRRIDLGDFDAIYDISPAYASGHLPGATNIGSVAGLDAVISSASPTGRYLVYCHGDGPAMQGAQKLEDAGFQDVYRLEGNYGAWVGAGYPTE